MDFLASLACLVGILHGMCCLLVGFEAFLVGVDKIDGRNNNHDDLVSRTSTVDRHFQCVLCLSVCPEQIIACRY